MAEHDLTGGSNNAGTPATAVREETIRVSTSTGPPPDSTLLQGSHKSSVPPNDGIKQGTASPEPGGKEEEIRLEDEHQARFLESSIEIEQTDACRPATKANVTPEAAESSSPIRQSHQQQHDPVEQGLSKQVLPRQDAAGVKAMHATVQPGALAFKESAAVSPLEALHRLGSAARQTNENDEDNGCRAENQYRTEKGGGSEAGRHAVEIGREPGEDKTEEGGREEATQRTQHRQVEKKRGQNDSIEAAMGEGAADDTKEDTAALAAEGTRQPDLGDHCVPSRTYDRSVACSTLAGTGPEVLPGSPPNEISMHTSIEQTSLRLCIQAEDGKGETQQLLATPLAALSVDSDAQLRDSPRIDRNATSLPAESVVLPTAASTAESVETTRIVVQLEARCERRPSYMPEAAMRPARSKARASIQLTLPPVLGEGHPVSAQGASDIDSAPSDEDPAEIEGGESGQPGEDESWQAYHAINPGRQHSTPNLVNIRRNRGPYRPVELIDASDSSHADAAGGNSSSSSSETESDADEGEEQKDKAEDPVSWQLSEEGKSRMAQLKKATVSVESPATKISRKYLKLFAPSNSVRFRKWHGSVG